MSILRARAIVLFGAVLLQAVGCTSPHISSGKIAFNRGDYDEALGQFSLAIEEEPGNALPYYWRAISHARKKRWQEYGTDMDQAFSLDSTFIERAKKEAYPDIHSLYFFHAANASFLEDKEYDLALRRAETSILLDSTNIYPMNLIALCLLELGQSEGAETTLKKAIERKPIFIDSYLCLAALCRRKTEYAREEEVLRKAMKIIDNPEWFGTVDADSLKIKKTDAATVYHHLGTSLFKQRKFDESLRLLETAMQFAPANGDIIFDLGMVFIEKQYWEKALKAFERVITIDPQDTRTYYYLGFSCLMLKEYPEAIEKFSRAIEQDPAWCDAYFKRAMCLRELGDRTAADSDVVRGQACEEGKHEK